MQIASILTPERTFYAASGQSKKRVFEFLASKLITDQHPARTQAVLDALLARERLGSTGLGLGIAVPHCRTDHCETVQGMLVSLDKAIPFDAPDQQAVDLMFVLLVPKGDQNNQDHLNTLAALAQRFSDTSYTEALRGAKSRDGLFAAAISLDET